MKKLAFIAAIALSPLASVPASAGQCGWDYCWGAVAFNPSTGHYGWAHSHFSEGQAAEAAQNGCGYNCTEMRTFYNQCGAVALGANGGSGWGYGLNRAAAESVAISYCNDYDYGCQILVWACSP